MKILFLPQTTRVGAASRTRIYDYLELVQDEFTYRIVPGTTPELDRRFLAHPTLFEKIRWFFGKIWGRLKCLASIRSYDCVYVQRESLPYFFPVVELLLAHFARRFVFDFDDAIFVYPKEKNWLKKMLMDERSVERIVRQSDRVIVSTSYLAHYACQFNDDVRIIPTCVKLKDFPAPAPIKDRTPLIIGWLGSRSTIGYLKEIEAVLTDLAKSIPFQLLIVGGGQVDIDGLETRCREWSAETEKQSLREFDIGLMPLPDNAWTRGKGGFKLLQYMAAGVPAVASAVGVNKKIIQDGVNGFLASSEDEWKTKLARLLTDIDLRRNCAQAGRKTIESFYSIEGNFTTWRSAVTEFET